jgi:hypothetical protein
VIFLVLFGFTEICVTGIHFNFSFLLFEHHWFHLVSSPIVGSVGSI